MDGGSSMSIQDIRGGYKKPRRPQTTDDLRIDRSHEKSADELRAEIASLQNEIAALKEAVQELQSQ